MGLLMNIPQTEFDCTSFFSSLVLNLSERLGNIHRPASFVVTSRPTGLGRTELSACTWR